MALRVRELVYSTPGTFHYVPPPDLYGVELLVRGGGGGGASGQHDSDEEDCRGGSGGGGGGCTFTPRMIRRDELPAEGVEIRVGAGGPGGRPPSDGWNPGYNGGDSWFGEWFAGGGGGGGRKYLHREYTLDVTVGGAPGYGMCPGGRGVSHTDPKGTGFLITFTPYRFSPADSFNAAHMAAGGGGGGNGKGWRGDWRTDEDTGKDELHKFSHGVGSGGSSGAVEATRTTGANGRGNLPYWQTLQSGCGGNGGGGNGGFPSGGGAGGDGNNRIASVTKGGDGAGGCVTVIEIYNDEESV